MLTVNKNRMILYRCKGPCGYVCLVVNSRPRGIHAAKMASLFLLLAFLLQTSVGTRSKLLLELVNSSRGVHKFQLTGVKRVASVANIDLHLARTNRTGFEGISATADDGSFFVLRVNAFFHGTNSHMSFYGGGGLANVQDHEAPKDRQTTTESASAIQLFDANIVPASGVPRKHRCLPPPASMQQAK